MNRHKSGILGLTLAFALVGVACEDKTEVVIPPPADPPIEVSVTPGAVTANVGQSATFVAQVTGGNASTVRTVTWASSNTAVAANPSAAGSTTCATAGTTTITATSTALASARAAATLTCVAPPPPPTPTVSIKSITQFATTIPVALNNVFGQIDITLNADFPAGSQVTALRTFIVRGTTSTRVCEQTFSGTAGEAGIGGDEAQSDVEIICSVNTAAYTGTPGVSNAATITFLNGPGYRVRVEIIRSGGTVAATIESADMLFNNSNFIVARLAQPTNCRNNAATGLVWCEGSIQGDFLPVVFTGVAGDAVTSITLNAFGAVGTDAAAPFSITLQKATTPAASSVAGIEAATAGFFVTSLTVGGQPGPTCINPDPTLNPQPACGVFANVNFWPFLNLFRLDNLAPIVTNFNVTPAALCPGSAAAACYLGPIFAFASGATIVQSGANFYSDTDGGVAGQTRVFRAGTAGSEVTVTTGTSLSTANGGPGESPVPNYVVNVTTTDALGNARTVWAGPNAALPLGSATGAQLIGYDETIPTHTHLAGPADMTVNTGIAAGTIGFTDSGIGPSGFLANPVQIKLERITAAGTVCLHPDTGVTISCTTNAGVVADDGAFTYPAPDGYYRLTVFVRDQAWNFSVTSTRFTLNDITPPTMGGIVSPATIAGGSTVSFTSALADAVDLGSYFHYVFFPGFGGVAISGVRTSIGTFGPSPINGTDAGAFTVTRFPRSIEGNSGGGLPTGAVSNATQVQLLTRDMAGHRLRYDVSPWAAFPNDGVCPVAGSADNAFTQNCRFRLDDITAAIVAGGAPGTSAYTALVTANGLNAAHGLWTINAPSATPICNNSARTSCPSSSTPLTTTLTAQITGPATVFQSPFVQVDFVYVNGEGRWELIGTAGAPVVTDNTVTNTRTITYTVTWDASNLKVRPAGAGGTAYLVAAFGRNATGDVLSSNGTVVTVHGN